MWASSTAIDYPCPAERQSRERADSPLAHHAAFPSEELRMLQAGDEAPDFSLESDEGDTVTLSALRGQPVVLYFYPKDDTPGCTAQACSLRDGYGDILASGAALYGISPDDSESHRAFRAKYALPFPLLVDTGHEVAEVYGVWAERPNGKMGIVRSAFVVGSDGRLLRASYGVKPEDTTPEALAALSA
jgi:thioredoxin-dependent peroxiredoxin